MLVFFYLMSSIVLLNKIEHILLRKTVSEHYVTALWDARTPRYLVVSSMTFHAWHARTSWRILYPHGNCVQKKKIQHSQVTKDNRVMVKLKTMAQYCYENWLLCNGKFDSTIMQCQIPCLCTNTQ